jgi:hypothetical protein
MPFACMSSCIQKFLLNNIIIRTIHHSHFSTQDFINFTYFQPLELNCIPRIPVSYDPQTTCINFIPRIFFQRRRGGFLESEDSGLLSYSITCIRIDIYISAPFSKRAKHNQALANSLLRAGLRYSPIQMEKKHQLYLKSSKFVLLGATPSTLINRFYLIWYTICTNASGSTLYFRLRKPVQFDKTGSEAGNSRFQVMIDKC